MYWKKVKAMLWVMLSTFGVALIAVIMIIFRLKQAQKPASKQQIILPPLMMSTGSLMFIFPMFRISWLQVIEAIGLGVLFAIPLIKTSHFVIDKDKIYLSPSKAFMLILLGLLVLRTLAKVILGSKISIGETGGMFYLLAFGMIFTWRMGMLYRFKQLEKSLKK